MSGKQANRGGGGKGPHEEVEGMELMPTDAAKVTENAKLLLMMLWEPFSGSPVSYIRTLNGVTRLLREGGPEKLNELDEQDKRNLGGDLVGNFILGVKRLVHVTEPFSSMTPEFMLSEEDRQEGRTRLVEAKLNGLLTGMDVCRWGIDMIVKKAVEHGVNPDDLWGWRPDPDIKGNAVTIVQKPIWERDLQEYMDGDKLPTLRQVHDLISETLEAYRAERLRTSNFLPEQ